MKKLYLIYKYFSGERPHACKQCDRAFIKKVDLQRHELTHTGVKPHVCTVCDKDFLRPLHLNYHMMIHTAERPHRCQYCGKGFIRRYYLKDHLLKHHGIKDSKKGIVKTGGEGGLLERIRISDVVRYISCYRWKLVALYCWCKSKLIYQGRRIYYYIKNVNLSFISYNNHDYSLWHS